MNASVQASHLCRPSGPGPARACESPKGFFRYLRSVPSYFHAVIAGGLHEAGFQVRYVRKRVGHDVWNAHLQRGSVSPGEEAETAQRAISAALERCGTECQEIEVAVIGQTLGAAFLFQGGAPGTLVFTKGRESWCADEWP